MIGRGIKTMDICSIAVGQIESVWVFSRRILRAAKRNEDGVRVLKIEWEKKFSHAEVLSLDRAGLMGVRPLEHLNHDSVSR